MLNGLWTLGLALPAFLAALRLEETAGTVVIAIGALAVLGLTAAVAFREDRIGRAVGVVLIMLGVIGIWYLATVRIPEAQTQVVAICGGLVLLFGLVTSGARPTGESGIV